MGKKRKRGKGKNKVLITTPVPILPKQDVKQLELTDSHGMSWHVTTMASGPEANTNKDDGTQKKPRKKKFRCELCALRMPYTRDELNTHVNGRNHINCQVLLERGQWPGVTAGQDSSAEKSSFRLYDFADVGSGRIKCNLCETFLSDPTALFYHQRLPTHAEKVGAKGASQIYPTLYHCEICAVKRLMIESRQEFEMHIKTPEHLMKLEEWNEQQHLEWRKKKDTPADTTLTDSSLEILFDETVPSSLSSKPSTSAKVVDAPTAPAAPVSAGKKVVRLKGLGPELQTAVDILSLCVPYGTVNRHVYLPKDKRALIEFSDPTEADKLNALVKDKAPVFSNGAILRVEFTNHESLKEENATDPGDWAAAQKKYAEKPVIAMPLPKGQSETQNVSETKDGECTVPEDMRGVPQWQSFFGPVVETGVQLPYMAQKTMYLRFGPEVDSELEMITMCSPFGTVVKSVFLNNRNGLVEFSKPEEAQRMFLTVKAHPPRFSNGESLMCDYSRQPDITGSGQDTSYQLQRTAFYNMCNQLSNFTKKPLLPYHQMPLPLPYSYIQEFEEKDPNEDKTKETDPRLPKIMELDQELRLHLTELEFRCMNMEDFEYLRTELANLISELKIQRKDYTTPRLAEVQQINDTLKYVPSSGKKKQKRQLTFNEYGCLEKYVLAQARLQYILLRGNTDKFTPRSMEILRTAKRKREDCKKTWTLNPEFGETIERMPSEVKEELNSYLDCLRVQELKNCLPKMVDEYEEAKQHFNKIKTYIQSCRSETELPQLMNRKQKLDTVSKDTLLKTRVAYVVMLGLVDCIAGNGRHNLEQLCVYHQPPPSRTENACSDFDDPYAVICDGSKQGPDEEMAVIGTYADMMGSFTDISLKHKAQDFCILCKKDVRAQGGLRNHIPSREHKCMLVLASHHVWPGPQSEDCVPQKHPRLYSFNQSDMIECSVCQLTMLTSVDLLRHQRSATHAHKMRMRKIEQLPIMYCEVCEVFYKPGNRLAFAEHLSSEAHTGKVRAEQAGTRNRSYEESIPKIDLGSEEIPYMVSEEQIRRLKDHCKSMLEFSLRPLVGDTPEAMSMSPEMRILRCIRPNMKDYLASVRDRDDVSVRLKRLEDAERVGSIEKGSAAPLRQKFESLQERVEICLLKDQVNFAVHHGMLYQLPQQARDIIFGMIRSQIGGLAPQNVTVPERPRSNQQQEIIEIGAPQWSPHDPTQTQLLVPLPNTSVPPPASLTLPHHFASSAPPMHPEHSAAIPSSITSSAGIPSSIITPAHSNQPNTTAQSQPQQAQPIDINKILQTLMPDKYPSQNQEPAVPDTKLEIVKEIIAQREAAKARQKTIDDILIKLSAGLPLDGIVNPATTNQDPDQPTTSQEPNPQPAAAEEPPTPALPKTAEDEKKWESSLEESLRRARWRAQEIAITDVWDTPRMCWVWDGDDLDSREFIFDCSAFFRELEEREEDPVEKRRRALEESVAAARAALAVPVPPSIGQFRAISDDEDDPNQPSTSRQRRSSSPEVVYQDTVNRKLVTAPDLNSSGPLRSKHSRKRRKSTGGAKKDKRIVLESNDSPGPVSIEMDTVSDIEEISDEDEGYSPVYDRSYGEYIREDEYFDMARHMGGWTPPEGYRAPEYYSPPGESVGSGWSVRHRTRSPSPFYSQRRRISRSPSRDHLRRSRSPSRDHRRRSRSRSRDYRRRHHSPPYCHRSREERISRERSRRRGSRSRSRDRYSSRRRVD